MGRMEEEEPCPNAVAPHQGQGPSEQGQTFHARLKVCPRSTPPATSPIRKGVVDTLVVTISGELGGVARRGPDRLRMPL